MVNLRTTSPRFSKYQSILFRLWEALVLAYLFRPVQGLPQVRYDFATSHVTTRRGFLQNLAYLCDYKRGGGTTTTSIAAEMSDGELRLWVSSNGGVAHECLDFLTGILHMLRGANNMDIGQQAVMALSITRRYTEFASPRLTHYVKRLSALAGRCKTHLQAGVGADYHGMQPLVPWLGQFQFGRDTDLYEVCRFAYDAQHDPQAHMLEHLASRPDDGTSIGAMSRYFQAISRMIGRLASGVRVPAELVRDACQFNQMAMLNSYRVSAVECPLPAWVPRADELTDLKSILGRMINDRGPRFDQLYGRLVAWDEIIGLKEQIDWSFDGGITTCVHAEVQMLEHFYRNDLRFAWDDKYVACSKPACLACRLYFQHHPARPVWLDSHDRIYVNWAPVLLAKGTRHPNHPLFQEERRLLDRIIPEICRVAIHSIEMWGLPSSNHMQRQESTTYTREGQGLRCDDQASTVDESEGVETGGGAPLY
ncbi:hypothetical protein ACRALDRAFT_2094136 [Sodiomyces alcalophilus JCM 7366]|uniref:uncharacterized protein n=1 Tax=Sodiomyces alcalophilus JCM 7366 TaxID=591952 RepID=UPI0039B4E9FF